VRAFKTKAASHQKAIHPSMSKQHEFHALFLQMECQRLIDPPHELFDFENFSLNSWLCIRVMILRGGLVNKQSAEGKHTHTH
jgi:hypothetical protein